MVPGREGSRGGRPPDRDAGLRERRDPADGRCLCKRRDLVERCLGKRAIATARNALGACSLESSLRNPPMPPARAVASTLCAEVVTAVRDASVMACSEIWSPVSSRTTSPREKTSTRS
ncbi:hypothetical protein [Streptosporangium amethystogenes]|uniref:hypothetical protein n=1 Tax=Streptosporangium amethystogenes TaxID=2002 RepID=UPI0004C5785D|nr:hypothetical protein [Streptosporangium amethystogenes]